MRGIYKTSQKEFLYNVIKTYNDKQFTAEDIIKEIPGNELGRSTVYRILNNFVNEGILRRYTEEKSRRFLYQFADNKACDSHFHLKCVNCGKVIHLKEEVSDNVLTEIMSEYNFKIDEKKTVFLGQCNNCTTV